MRKKRWLMIGLGLLAAAAVAGGFGIWLQKEKQSVSGDSIVVQEQDYSVQDEVEEAARKLQNDPAKPTVITDINTVDKEIALCFEGSADRLVIERILEYLELHGMHATFFIAAVDTAEDEELAEEILAAGQEIESYSLYGTAHMEKMSDEELIADFCRAQAVYEDKISRKPEMLKCNATEYTDELLEAADACGYQSVVYPTVYLNYQSFYTEKAAQDFVSSLGCGRVLSVKLSGYLDETEYEETKQEEKPAKDKQPELELHELEEEELTETNRLLQVVEWLLGQLDAQAYKTVSLRELPEQDLGDIVLKYEEIEDQYREQMTEPVTSVHTTDRETAFTFFGLGDAEELKNVLQVLQNRGIGATFFVSGKEVEQYPEQLQMIRDAGFEIGSSGYNGKSMGEMTFGEICEDIYKNDLLLAREGIETDLLMPPYGQVTDEIKMAAAAMEKQIILYNAAPARAEYVSEGYDAKTCVRTYFSKARPVLCRGDITCFNLNVYEDAVSAAELVDAVYQEKVLPTAYGTRADSILRVTDVSTLMDHTWAYPAATDAVWQMITPGGKSVRTLQESLATHYIGTPWQELSGFSEGELAAIDQEGRIQTGGSGTVFLTFDDWGNEATIGRILYVLKKHGVKASFFIKTEYVEDGSTENLLRAIAEDGHDIGSHTNEHIPIDTGEDQVGWLQQDLVKSNRTLARIVGNTGAMKSYFRPPTLAVNRTGVNTVYDCGYEWIVCGEVSTGDYHVQSVEEMFDILQNGVINDDGSRTPLRDGTVVVMHINENSVYTAQGLDRYLTWQEELPEGDPGKFHFARLSDYLN